MTHAINALGAALIGFGLLLTGAVILNNPFSNHAAIELGPHKTQNVALAELNLPEQPFVVKEL